MRHFLLLAILGTAAGISGCNWDDVLYQDFYDKETKSVNACPSSKHSDLNKKFEAIILSDTTEILCTQFEERNEKGEQIEHPKCINYLIKLNAGNTNIISQESISQYCKKDKDNNKSYTCKNVPAIDDSTYEQALQYQICPSNFDCRNLEDPEESEDLAIQQLSFTDGDADGDVDINIKPIVCIARSKTEADMIACSTGYIDPKTNSQFCGASGDCKGNNAGENCETTGQTCVDGHCECQSPSIMCNEYCVDFTKINTEYDNRFCGPKEADSCNQVINCDTETTGNICVSGECIKNICTNDNEQMCLINGKSQCKDLTSDSQNCGSCLFACKDNKIPNATSEVCANSSCQYTCDTNYVNVGSGKTADTIRCIDPKQDNEYCGATSADDPGINCAKGTSCVDGTCIQNSCSGSTPDLCVVDGQNTCKSISSNDTDHCGACNYKCSDHAIQNATTETCANGECQYVCSTGFVNVETGNTLQTIKCIDPKTDNTYCGAKSSEDLGTSCPEGTVCVDGTCKTNECKESSAPNLCVVNGSNTCLNVNGSDANHCGACNYKCSEHKIQNATSETCAEGACQYTCSAGFVNVGVGSTSQTIKCIDPKTDITFCGAKSVKESGESCPSGKVCVDGSCKTNECIEASKPNLCVVSGANTCLNVNSTDANHCGACNYKCSEHAIQNATSNSCKSGACQYTCSTGYVNVGTGSTSQTIKCIDPKSDNNYCGATSSSAKGKSCTNGTVCVDGTCKTNECKESSKPNLCVVSGVNTCLNVNSTDANHCGACNYKCSDHAIQNATSSSCASGACQYTCSTGYVNVGKGSTSQTIKCIDPKTDNNYCGATSASNVGTNCTGGKVCVNGACEQNTCSNNETLCLQSDNKTKICKTINGSDASNCGACNYICSDHAIQNATSNTCASGACQYTCSTGYVNVGKGSTSQTIKCIDPKTDNSYCGASSASKPGTSCTGGKVCVDGICDQNSCKEKPNTPNLCVVDGKNDCYNINSTDANHCGACNYKCSDHAIQNATSSTCASGACQYTCSTGFVNVSTGKAANTIKCIDPKTDNNYCGATSASNVGTSCTGGKICVGGSCVTNSCTDSTKPNLCIDGDSRTCVDLKTSTDHCGYCGYKCSANMPGWKAGNCVNGKCEATSCTDAYNLTNKQCVIKTVTCAESEKNCHNSCIPSSVYDTAHLTGTGDSCNCVTGFANNNNYWADGCEACASGYHSYNNGCEKDDAQHCGSHDKACATNETCNGGVCKCGSNAACGTGKICCKSGSSYSCKSGTTCSDTQSQFRRPITPTIDPLRGSVGFEIP